MHHVCCLRHTRDIRYIAKIDYNSQPPYMHISHGYIGYVASAILHTTILAAFNYVWRNCSMDIFSLPLSFRTLFVVKLSFWILVGGWQADDEQNSSTFQMHISRICMHDRRSKTNISNLSGILFSSFFRSALLIDLMSTYNTAIGKSNISWAFAFWAYDENKIRHRKIVYNSIEFRPFLTRYRRLLYILFFAFKNFIYIKCGSCS